MPVPVASVPRTVRPSVWPTSFAPCVYVAFVAPCTDLQCAPLASQRYHWNAKLTAPEPDHVPGEPVSCARSCAVPVTTGTERLTGPGATAIGRDVVLKASCAPPSTVACTTASSV